LLNEILPDGKLPLVTDGLITDIDHVRKQFSQIQPFAKLRPDVRGWTLDVLKAVHRLKKTEFTLSDIYSFESELAKGHPANRNVRPKIRQQLQKLRDLELVEFISHGHYRLLESK